jgi:RNA polymerase sigma-70 factor (sigma-E family)
VAPSPPRFPAGNPDFEAFVRDTGPALLRFGHVLTLNRSEAEDLAQETYIRVGLAWSRVRRDGNPAGYARRTMVNLFLNQRKRRSELPMATLPDTARDEAGHTEVGAMGEIRRLLASLPRQQRAAIALRYVVDTPDSEIAQLLGCTPQTVRAHISRGLSTLRHQSTHDERRDR